jgi:hypothetical protein
MKKKKSLTLSHKCYKNIRIFKSFVEFSFAELSAYIFEGFENGENINFLKEMYYTIYLIFMKHNMFFNRNRYVLFHMRNTLCI